MAASITAHTSCDQAASLRHLPLEPEQHSRLESIIANLQERVPPLYDRLPQQLVHRDFDASNVLVEGGRVTAVLDFEFAGRDLRVFDLAVALSRFRRHPWSDPAALLNLVAFGQGYGAEIEVTEAEMAVLPSMMLLSRAHSVLSREARRREGRAEIPDVVSRARELLRMHAWLEEKADRLVMELSTEL